MTQANLDPNPSSEAAHVAASNTKLERAWEWLWQNRALKAARADAKVTSPNERLAIEQARALLDLGERVRDRVASVSADSVDTTALVLFHRAGLTALATLQKADQSPAAAWLEKRQEIVNAADLGDVALLRADQLFPAEVRLDATLTQAQIKSDADLLHRLVSSLLMGLDGPERKLGVVRWLRFFRVSVLATVLGVATVAAILGVMKITAPPNLLEGKAPQASSVYPADVSGIGLLFHTNSEKNPWVLFDLGAIKTVKSIEVQNRADGSRDRAFPLALEVSTDKLTWREVVRRDQEFEHWKGSFAPVSARYLRLTVKKPTYFHLSWVKAY